MHIVYIERSDTNMEWMSAQNPVLLALIATLGTWALTALGAGLVFFFKEINQKILNAMLGFAAGVMIAASFWSLLAPAIEMAEGRSLPAWMIAAIGFLAGALFLWLAVGVAFGAAASSGEAGTIAAAIAVAVGIALCAGLCSWCDDLRRRGRVDSRGAIWRIEQLMQMGSRRISSFPSMAIRSVTQRYQALRRIMLH